MVGSFELLARIMNNQGTAHGGHQSRVDVGASLSTPSWPGPISLFHPSLSARAACLLVMLHICLPLSGADSTTTVSILAPRPPADLCGVPRGTAI